MTTHRAPMPREAYVCTKKGLYLRGHAVGRPIQEFGKPDADAHERATAWLSELESTGAYYVGHRSEITMKDVQVWREKLNNSNHL